MPRSGWRRISPTRRYQRRSDTFRTHLVYIYIYISKFLKNRTLLKISNIRHAISGVNNGNLDKPPWRVGVRNTRKNFSVPKWLKHAPMSLSTTIRSTTTITTLKISTVTKPAPHHSYCWTRSFAHLDNAMFIRHIGIKTTHIEVSDFSCVVSGNMLYVWRVLQLEVCWFDFRALIIHA